MQFSKTVYTENRNCIIIFKFHNSYSLEEDHRTQINDKTDLNLFKIIPKNTINGTY